jgi:hypothetical protein
MSLSSAPYLQEQHSPTLSARVTELVQYLNAPLAGRLTDEQRSISLAITRRIVTSVARRIDPVMDLEQLWSDWLVSGVPATAELASMAFSRCEEHRWRTRQTEVDFLTPSTAPMMFSQTSKFDDTALHADTPELSAAYLRLQIADRLRIDSFGYPCLGIDDLPDELYRHLLNEIARWRLRKISRDRISSEILGEAVRRAWRERASEPSITFLSIQYYEQLCVVNRLVSEANAAVQRQDWLAVLAITAATRSTSYCDAVLHLTARSEAELATDLAHLQLSPENMIALEASLNSLPARIASSGGAV